MVPEDLLSEPTDGGMMDICTDILDVGLELSRAASRASSTLECGLQSQEAGLGCSIPMEVTENPSALEVAVAENLVPKDGASDYPAPEGVAGNDPAWVGSASYNPAPEGAAGGDPAPMGNAGCDPAPEGVRAGSPSHTSMYVHVGSSPPHSDCMAAACASNQEVALETGTPDARVLIPTGDVELIPNDALQIASADIPSSSHQLASHDLGLPSFFSNLQVIWFFMIWLYSGRNIVFTLICFQYQALVDEMAGQLRSQGASVPERALSLMHWNPMLLQRRVSDLDTTNAGQCLCFLLGYLINLLFTKYLSSTIFLLDMVWRYSELEEKYSQGQMDLARVSASLDDANLLNSSLSAQLDSERVANEVSLL
jgi:hypothetical protein